jgi:hypothetical protein
VFTTQLQIAQRLKKEQVSASTPLWAFMACPGVNFSFTLPGHTSTALPEDLLRLLCFGPTSLAQYYTETEK